MKKMTEKVNALAPKIWKEIKKSHKVLLCLHPGADGDSVGGCLAMMHFLEELGKKVTLIGGDSPFPDNLKCLPGSEKVLQMSYGEIDSEDFDLFLILDAGDAGQISKKGKVVFPKKLSTIVIDHHATNKGFGKINLIDTSSPAVCQIIYELIKAWKKPVSLKAAECLLFGIYSDTGGFKYPKTTIETFSTAAKLAKIAPDFTKIISASENNKTPEQIRFIGLALSQVEEFFSGKVAFSMVTAEDLKASKIKRNHLEKTEIVNFLNSVSKWKISVSFLESEAEVTSLSLRTKNPEKYDVAKIAAATGFGGGHPAASGAILKMPNYQAKKFILKIIQDVYPSLGEP